ncbi:DUF6221 family protein [Actinomadura sp. NPDC049382]|uniref:DUF6221 family protein n=1 Tax=Actinomadura sp. NPDC049382 TaxID=3158220 RepID=UPI003433306C
MTLVEFLNARLDEDEQTAREAGNRRWLIEDNTISLWPENEHDGFMTWPTRSDARHAVHWQPERVLAEVEAKRRIVDEHGPNEYGLCDVCVLNDDARRAPCPTLRLLALPYADHPDYDESWRP